MSAKKKLADRIFRYGIIIFIVPLIVIISLLSIVFVKLRMLHKDYNNIVHILHSDIDSIDKRLHKYTVNLNENQRKIQSVNKARALQTVNEKLIFSTAQLVGSFLDTQILKIPVDRNLLVNLYFDSTAQTRTLAKKQLTLSVMKPDPSKPVPATNPGKIPDLKLPARSPSDNKGVNDTEDLKKRIMLLRTGKNLDSKQIKTLMKSFLKNAKVFNRNSVYFLIDHEDLHKHRIIWASQPAWTDRLMADFEPLEPLRGLLISTNYMRTVLDFHDFKSEPVLLKNLISAGATGTEAKYSISKDMFYGMVPVFGTSLSLGIQTPMNDEFVRTLDSISDNMGLLSTFLKSANLDIRKADSQTRLLHQRFDSETRNSNSMFIYILIFALIFVGVGLFLLIHSLQKRVVKPIMEMRKVSSLISEGDYGARCSVDTDDELEELSESINIMLDRIVSLIQSEEDKVNMQADIVQLLDVVSQASAGDLTVRGSVNTADFQAVMDALNHMMSSIGNLVIRVRASGNGVEHYSRLMLDTSRAILDKSNKQTTDLDIATRKIKALGDRSQEITRMVEQIGSIAIETNTLALNATLEASRTGDRDTGISHLAEHVRQLADGLKKTKQDIDSFMGSIQLATNHAVHSMEEVLSLTRETTGQAKLSFENAESTHNEANQLAKSISIFKIKTQLDLEKENELKTSVKNIITNIKQARKLITSIETDEFQSFGYLFESFEKDIREFAMMVAKSGLDSERGPSSDEEVPAIIEE
ncbi:methyl-accepting chemotaxis protein [Myxococcota bacterium]|nr:methyl-accepting chemotaxis protein [Myxococcota bacterium]MBU1381333.1 methyl-accepting chemotaxis protein [Myxococcota bacterium]MBU1495710.1 methyl-accepting chemotaxis protein [Myxococcota bacterium]